MDDDDMFGCVLCPEFGTSDWREFERHCEENHKPEETEDP